MIKKEELVLVTEWDKTFPQSNKVEHSKVTFVNRYGITLAADMYVPKDKEGKLPAIAVCGPFGAVKEQCSAVDCMRRTWQREDFLRLPLILLLPEKAAGMSDIWLLRISIQRTLWRQLIFFR